MWTELDRSLHLEHLAEQEAVHPGCGQPMELATDPTHDGNWDVHVVVCFPCRAREQRARDDQQRGADMTGRHYIPVLREG